MGWQLDFSLNLIHISGKHTQQESVIYLEREEWRIKLGFGLQIVLNLTSSLLSEEDHNNQSSKSSSNKRTMKEETFDICALFPIITLIPSLPNLQLIPVTWRKTEFVQPKSIN